MSGVKEYEYKQHCREGAILCLPWIKQSFHDKGEIVQWLKNEITFLSTIQNALSAEKHFTIYNLYQATKENFEISTKNISGNTLTDTLKEDLFQRLKTAYEDGIMFHQSLAAEELSFLINSHPNRPMQESVRTKIYYKVALYRENHLEKQRAGLDGPEGRLALFQKQLDEFRAQLAAAAQELLDYDNKTKENRALTEPSKYWETLSKEYEEKATTYGWGFFSYLVLLFILVCNNSATILEITKPTANLPYPFGATAIILLMLTIAIWPMRILARLYMSTMHLSRDAKERSIMTRAYLMLMEKKSGFEPAERAFFYQTLFTPSQTGLAQPTETQTPLETLTRIVEQGQKKQG